jgi:uncharacterized repeat protein (TIGR01451 family)
VVSNTATVNTGNDGTDTSTATVTVQCPAIHIVKTANPVGPVSAGTAIGFDITVSNSGPGMATGVHVTDLLPAGGDLSWSLSPAFSGCTITGVVGSQILDCTFVSLGSGGSIGPIHITSATSQADCAVVSNTAVVVTGNDGLDSSTATVTVQCPALTLTKTADAATVSAGSQIGFTVTVSNSNAAGTGTATGVTIDDALPAGSGVDWSIASGPANCTITGAVGSEVLHCSAVSLASGQSESVHVTSGTSFASCAIYPNTATADATNAPELTASASTTVQCPALTLTKTADAATVSAGSQIGFTVTVSNSNAAGTGTATAVTLSDPLPAGSGINWSINPAYAGPGTCSVTGAVGSQVLNCSFGNMAAGASASVHLTSATSFASCATYPNTATAHATNHANVTASASTTVQCPSLHVTKTADAATVSAGDPIGFTIGVSNSGPGTATAVTLTDPLPAGSGVNWSINPAYAGPGTCSITGAVGSQSLSCSFGNLASGGSASVHIQSATTPNSCATYPNTATAHATNHPNVTASASITVQCPDVTVSKSADATPINAGATAGFTITVTNLGPGTARSVTLTDTLPGINGLNWSIVSQPAGNPCSISGAVGSQTLSCAFGDLTSGASRVVHITSPTNTRLLCYSIPNTARVAATNEPSTKLGNNQASATIVVNCIHPGTVGFWRNWRNHYSTTQMNLIINRIKADNPIVYNAAGFPLTIAVYDAILNFGNSTPNFQQILGQLTSVKSSLAITALQGTGGLVQFNDNLCPAGTVNVAGISGAAAFFGSATPTVQQVITKVESTWTGKLTTLKKDWTFNLTKAQQAIVISTLTGINEGTLITTSGC